MFPERVMEQQIIKTNHFRYLLETKGDVSHPYIDNYFKQKFNNLHLTKERVLTDIMDTIMIAKNSGDLKAAFTGYKLLSDLLGMNITKSQIELTSTSLVLHYHQPEEKNITLNGHPILSITQTGSSMENNQ
jgi:hypothetical protein